MPRVPAAGRSAAAPSLVGVSGGVPPSVPPSAGRRSGRLLRRGRRSSAPGARGLGSAVFTARCCLRCVRRPARRRGCSARRRRLRRGGFRPPPPALRISSRSPLRACVRQTLTAAWWRSAASSSPQASAAPSPVIRSMSGPLVASGDGLAAVRVSWSARAAVNIIQSVPAAIAAAIHERYTGVLLFLASSASQSIPDIDPPSSAVSPGVPDLWRCPLRSRRTPAGFGLVRPFGCSG